LKKLIAISAVIISILFTLVFAGGCLGQRIAEKVTEEAIEKAIEKESGQDVEIDLDEGEITIQGDDGEVNISSDDETVEIQSDEGEATFGTGAELPEDFPAEIPVYNNMDITTSMSGTNDGKTSYTVTAMSADSVDDIYDWYESQLSGWEITAQFSMDTDNGQTASITAESADYEMSLMIAEDEEGTVVVIGANQK
jgi:hypothetical protein